MVLQQRMAVPVWGWASPGESVVVSGSWGSEAKVVTDASGRWMVNLETPAYGGPYSVGVQGRNRVVSRKCDDRGSLALCRPIEYGLEVISYLGRV